MRFRRLINLDFIFDRLGETITKHINILMTFFYTKLRLSQVSTENLEVCSFQVIRNKAGICERRIKQTIEKPYDTILNFANRFIVV